MVQHLGVQVVTYRNPLAQLRRALAAVEAGIGRARARGLVDRAAVRLGDCSETPTYDDRALGELRAGVPSATFSSVFFDANLGSGGGSNALAALADAGEELTLVLNPDTYLAPNCISELITAVAADGVGAADARQIPLEHPKAYDPVTFDTSWASGCCLMFRRAAFDAVDGFDDHFFPMYCDDVDVSWRLRAAGYRVVHAPRAAVFHDKRFDDGGGVESSEFAQYSSGLARLFLAHRYGRPDIAAELLGWIDRMGADAPAPHRRLRDEYLERSAGGDVPPLLEGAERVAQFVDGEYAVHRWTYGAN